MNLAEAVATAKNEKAEWYKQAEIEADKLVETVLAELPAKMAKIDKSWRNPIIVYEYKVGGNSGANAVNELVMKKLETAMNGAGFSRVWSSTERERSVKVSLYGSV